jgi:predicted glycosyltransferase
MSQRPAILFYCQHSLGMGHLVRSLALAESLAKRFRVVLLNGGRLPKGITVPLNIETVNLPPLGMDEGGRLVSNDKRISVERALDRRQRTIRESFADLRPAVVFVELFPFGRKKFAGELLPILERARRPETRALVVCSSRDILVSGRKDQQQHDDRAAAWANEYFDLILVHSDPRFARFEDSFHPHIPLRVPVKYTGFVVPRARTPAPKQSTRKAIVVSAGGGIVGEPLLRLAIEAHSQFADDPRIEMKVIGGPLLPRESWQLLRNLSRTKARLKLVKQVSDLSGELTGAALSISQAGYNTCLDVVRAGVPALLVPFARGNEDEQHKRALRLQDLGLVKVLAKKEQTAEGLANEIRRLLKFKFAKAVLDLNGAERSLELITQAHELV